MAVTPQDVVTETQRNQSRKAPEVDPLLAKLFEAVDFEIVPDLPGEVVWAAEKYVAQKNAYIVAAAIGAQADFVATFDRKHPIDPTDVRRKSELSNGTPGYILGETRKSSE